MGKVNYLYLFIVLGLCNLSFNIDNNCLYKNPLCFYNTDILTYLQVLHKNQQYDKILCFVYGPAFKGLSNNKIKEKLSNVDFGYTLKRVGIIEKTKTNWSLTYQRTIQGTNENFKIECALINDTCKLYLDTKKWETLFKK
jgi:hypothetical protein